MVKIYTVYKKLKHGSQLVVRRLYSLASFITATARVTTDSLLDVTYIMDITDIREIVDTVVNDLCRYHTSQTSQNYGYQHY
jgi:hypothetical protein